MTYAERPYTESVADEGKPSNELREPDERDLAGKDPMEVLRAALAISPEDAKQARDDAAKKGADKQR